MIQWCGNQHFNEPENAAGVAVTPSGTTNANSSWFDVFTAGEDCVLTGISMILPDGGLGFNWLFVVEVGIGGVVIAAHGGMSMYHANNGWGYLPFRIPIDAIPSGSTVQIRMRKTGTDTDPWTFALTFYQKPLVGNLLTTVYPQSVSAIVSVTPHNSPWTDGSWFSLHTFGNDGAVSGFIHGLVGNGMDYVFEFGIASAVVFSIKGRNGLGGWPMLHVLKHPLMVGSGVTLQGRYRHEGFTSAPLPTAITYYDQL